MVAVQIFAKSREENLPSLKKYLKLPGDNNTADSGKILIERTYTEIDDPDQETIP